MQPEERARRSAMILHWLCIPAVAYCLAAAAFYRWLDPHPALVVVNLVAGGAVLANEGAFLLHKRLVIAQNAFAAIGVACLVPMFLTGGVGGAGFAWYFAYPLFAYALLGPRMGTVWAVALPAITALVLVAGVVAPPYPTPFLIDAVWAYALSMSLAYILDRAYERSQRRVEEAAKARLELEALRRADELKTALLSTVSHELKTPLTPLKLQTQLLASEAAGPLTERQRRSVAIMHRNLDRLAALVQQTLDVARLQGGHIALDPRPVAVEALAQEAVESFEETAKAKRIALTLHRDGGCVAIADPPRLTQVISTS